MENLLVGTKLLGEAERDVAKPMHGNISVPCGTGFNSDERGWLGAVQSLLGVLKACPAGRL